MNIKIGNFNFITDNENKLSNLGELEKKENYFFLDGMENKLFVTNTTRFQKNEHEKILPEFEQKLVERFEIIPYLEEIHKEINDFIIQKAEDFINNKNYSKYNLYKEIELGDITEIPKKDYSIFSFNYHTPFYMNFDTNKIEIGDFKYNPYKERIDNLENLYYNGELDPYIKRKMIQLEVEKNIAPPFIKTILEISDFLEDKKQVSLEIKGENDLRKVDAHIGWILDKRGNEISFEKGEKIEDLVAIYYGKKIFKIDTESLKNIQEQIIKTPEDKLNFKIDKMKEDLKNNFKNFKSQNTFESYIPSSLKECEKYISDIHEHNMKVRRGLIQKEGIDFPDWYNNGEYLKIQEFRTDIKLLEETSKIENIKVVAYNQNDEELKKIYEELKQEKELKYEEEDEL